MRREVILLTLLLLAGPAPAEACHPPDPPETVFKRLDADRDGYLTLEEFDAGADFSEAVEKNADFARLDADRDGRLSLAEYTGAPQPSCGDLQQ